DDDRLPRRERVLERTDRATIPAGTVDGDRAERREHGMPETGAEELLLREEAQTPLRDRRDERDIDDAPVDRRQDVDAGARDALGVVRPQTEEEPRERDEE